MDNYLAELAKSRAILLNALMDLNWSYTGRTSKVDEINEQLKKIDALINQVLGPPASTPKEELDNAS